MNRINGTSPLARYEIASGATIEPRDIVALNGDGKAVPAADTAGLKVIGVAAKVDADGVEVESGIYSFANDTTHAVTRAARGTACFIKDKATVTATGTNSIAAGIVVDVHDGEVYVDLSPAAIKAAGAITTDTNTTYGAAAADTLGLVKQAAAVADCEKAGAELTSAETQLNALLAALRAAGIVAPNAAE